MSTEAQADRTNKWIEEQLDRGLPAEAIKIHPYSRLEYINQVYLIPEANRIFGYGGWSSQVIDGPKLVDGFTREVDEWEGEGRDRRKTGRKVTNYVRIFSSTVRVTALGVSHDGVGVGTADAPIESLAGNTDKAIKESETDALKRAFIKLGDHFGLTLYEKVKSERNIEPPETAAGNGQQPRAQSAPSGGGMRDPGAALAALGSGPDRVAYFRKMLPLVQTPQNYDSLRGEREALPPAVAHQVREELAAEWKAAAVRVGWTGQGAGGGAPARAAAVHPDWPTVFPNYGQAKGRAIADATPDDLDYYARGARKSLGDPSKERHHDKERLLLAAIEHEIAQRRAAEAA